MAIVNYPLQTCIYNRVVLGGIIQESQVPVTGSTQLVVIGGSSPITSATNFTTVSYAITKLSQSVDHTNTTDLATFASTTPGQTVLNYQAFL